MVMWFLGVLWFLLLERVRKEGKETSKVKKLTCVKVDLSWLTIEIGVEQGPQKPQNPEAFV
jgi:hypothetical protein